MIETSPSVVNLFHVFVVYDDKNEIVYIGHDELPYIFNFRKLRKDPSFDLSKTYKISIQSVHARPLDAINAARVVRHILCGETIPKHNKTIRLNRMGAVICEQTGEVYKNAKTAAEANGVSRSMMSAHLARQVGYKTVKDKTFAYVTFRMTELKKT